MIARAPGKLVLSGAYSVLEGAPAIVAAVDRYVVADGARAAVYEADEVKAAVAMGAMDRPVWYDASALRDGDRKLGLGSSAAILAASLAAALGERFADEAALRAAIFPLALQAHRAAQGGGSGVDVAASVFGGVLRAQLTGGALEVTPGALPPGAVVEVYASPVSASTRELLARVRALGEVDPARHRACLDAAGEGARRAVAARSLAELVSAVQAQTDALGALGEAAGAGIVTTEVAALRAPAEALGGTFAPSGAGGGDIAFFLGPEATTAAFRALAVAHGLARVELVVGAEGAGRAPNAARS